MIVYADEGASEGEYLAEGDEDGMVNLAYWRAAEARYEQCAPESAHCSSGDELKAFHHIISSATFAQTNFRRVLCSVWFLKSIWSCACLVGAFRRAATAEANCPQ